METHCLRFFTSWFFISYILFLDFEKYHKYPIIYSHLIFVFCLAWFGNILHYYSDDNDDGDGQDLFLVLISGITPGRAQNTKWNGRDWTPVSHRQANALSAVKQWWQRNFRLTWFGVILDSLSFVLIYLIMNSFRLILHFAAPFFKLEQIC